LRRRDDEATMADPRPSGEREPSRGPEADPLDLKSCRLCPRRCAVDRTAGEKGFCGLGDGIVLAGAWPHFGEEPPISGERGAGTLFFSSCNLRCPFCQNHQISHRPRGKNVTVDELASIMLDLQERGCHNVEAVTPTPQMPLVLASLRRARERGLRVPFIHNNGGYEDPAVIRSLKGAVDIYLPDLKFASEERSAFYAGVRDYLPRAVAAIREMASQVGDRLETDRGVAVRGLLVRHLVLPGDTANSLAVLKIIRSEISPRVPLSLMAQYSPVAAVRGHPTLGRRVRADEYEEVLEAALDMGFEELYIQAVDERDLVPDFDREEPFAWYRGQ